MLAWIDGQSWMDFAMVSALWLIVGIWLGRRWERVKQEAKCEARNCDTIRDIRREKMQAVADAKTAQEINEWQREKLIEINIRNHKLKSVNGKLAKELERLTYQLPRPLKRVV